MTWESWVKAVADGVVCVPDDKLRCAAEVIHGAKIVLAAGNGGSSAIASHAAQAILKPDYAAGGGRAAVCLTDGVPTVTAHANDGGWNSALEECARPFLALAPGIVLLAISSSGRSENVVRLARLVRSAGGAVVALTGFDGEPLRSLATVSLHVCSRDYEVVEPVHDALIHRVQYHLRELATVDKPRNLLLK